MKVQKSQNAGKEAKKQYDTPSLKPYGQIHEVVKGGGALSPDVYTSQPTF